MEHLHFPEDDERMPEPEVGPQARGRNFEQCKSFSDIRKVLQGIGDEEQSKADWTSEYASSVSDSRSE